MMQTNLAPLPETLLITVWARAEESRRRDGALLRDAVAESLVEQIDYDFDRFRGAWKTQIGVAVRGRVIDEHVRAFLDRHPEGTVVNLGAGLDTRAARLRAGGRPGGWIDVDLPEVIEIRDKLMPPGNGHRHVTASITDPEWIDDLPSGPSLFVAEGVLMFLSPDDVAALVTRLGLTHPGSEIILDVIGGLMVTCPWLHDSLPKVADGRVRFSWGIAGARTLERRFPPLRVHVWRSMLDEAPSRWRWMRGLRRVPIMRRQFAVVRATLGTTGRTC